MPDETLKAAQAAKLEAHELAQHVEKLAEEFHAARLHDRLLRRLVLGVVVIAVVGIIAGTVFSVLFYRQAQAAERGRDQIVDCVIPKGTCYRQGQQRTQAAIGQIVDANHNGRPDTQEILDALKAQGGKR